ncbi:MAG: RNA 2',3'-cyclic phosphodiesterase [Terriglobia bacterium]
MRLFVALDLPPPLREALQELVRQLQRAAADVRWVRPEGMHLTLKFIGEVPEEKLPLIQEALGEVASPAPAELDFRSLGYFPNERRPRVLWVGVQASNNLAPLAAQIEAALEPLGIPRERRAYAPHLTLGRFKSPKRLARLQEEVGRLREKEFGRVRVEEFALYQSRLSPGGAQYTRLQAFPFVRS